MLVVFGTPQRAPQGVLGPPRMMQKARQMNRPACYDTKQVPLWKQASAQCNFATASPIHFMAFRRSSSDAA